MHCTAKSFFFFVGGANGTRQPRHFVRVAINLKFGTTEMRTAVLNVEKRRLDIFCLFRSAERPINLRIIFIDMLSETARRIEIKSMGVTSAIWWFVVEYWIQKRYQAKMKNEATTTNAKTEWKIQTFRREKKITIFQRFVFSWHRIVLCTCQRVECVKL